MRITTQNLGPFGTGSNMFRCGVEHSSGVVFIGTYGPQPAIIWRFDPATGELRKIGAPGEYQLDCMVEAPNGMVYIGTAYEGLVYKLDPKTEQITTLGSPPVESTKWIFNMARTRAGEIYGAKGVGLFQLDWRNDRFEPIGLVPGDHRAPTLPSSGAITRMLHEDPTENVLWGDTNRWLFRYHIESRRIEPVADMPKLDPSIYCLFLPTNPCPIDLPEIYFGVFARFTGHSLHHALYACRRRDGRVEPLEISGLEGRVAGHPDWWLDGTQARLLVHLWSDAEERLRTCVIDPVARRVVDQWDIEGRDVSLLRLCGNNHYYFSSGRGQILLAEPEQRRIRSLASNPTPAATRCLGISPVGVLGTDTFDCGFAFTRDLTTGQTCDHGRVWSDDHRCNYGPAAFAGADGRYFIANHGQATIGLWATDIQENRHRQIGESAIQLVRFRGGSVWGTVGPSVDTVDSFHPVQSWTPRQASAFGSCFRYRPGEAAVEILKWIGYAGPLAELPDHVLIAKPGQRLHLVSTKSELILQYMTLDQDVLSMTSAVEANVAYVLTSDQALWKYDLAKPEAQRLSRVAPSFGSAASRGLFVLPASGRVVGIGVDGNISVYDPADQTVHHVSGPPPLPSGPAVDARDDAWYFADREIVRYSLDI